MRASFNLITAAAAASFSSGFTTETQVSNRKANVMLKIFGGKTDIWLQLNQQNKKTIQKKWTESMKIENMFPLNMRLVPLWALLEHKDANFRKAEELKKYMKDQWAKSGNTVPHYSYAPEVSAATPAPEVKHFDCTCWQNTGGFYGTYSSCVLEPTPQCRRFCNRCDSNGKYVGHHIEDLRAFGLAQ